MPEYALRQRDATTLANSLPADLPSSNLLKMRVFQERKWASNAHCHVGKKWSLSDAQYGTFLRIPYSDNDQRTWRLLLKEQLQHFGKYHCVLHLSAYQRLGITESRLPDMQDLDYRLHESTGWRLMEVDGVVEKRDYFNLLSQRVQPFSPLIRPPHPTGQFFLGTDILHDLCHLSGLFHPAFADFCASLGEFGKRAYETNDRSLLMKSVRLAWHLIECSVIGSSEHDCQIFGALLASSYSETKFVRENFWHLTAYDSIEQVTSTPAPWELLNNYKAGIIQPYYFRVDSFEKLLADFSVWRDQEESCFIRQPPANLISP